MPAVPAQDPAEDVDGSTAAADDEQPEQPGEEPPAVGGDDTEAGAADQAATNQEPSAADALAKADEAEAKAQAALEERRRVERENRLAQEEYEEKLKTAQKRVRELNNRFADWYYVVSDAEYAKIRLGRSDVIQEKSADGAATPSSGPLP